jgi:hypothetical protein
MVFDTKTFWLTDRQSQCDFDFDFDNELVVRQPSASKDVNTEAEEATSLEAVARRQTVKIQQTEKTSYVM